MRLRRTALCLETFVLARPAPADSDGARKIIEEIGDGGLVAEKVEESGDCREGGRLPSAMERRMGALTCAVEVIGSGRRSSSPSQ